MAIRSKSVIKVRTRASRGEHDGVLFYILPPLLLGAVFAFCSLASRGNDGGDDAQPAAEVSAEE